MDISLLFSSHVNPYLWKEDIFNINHNKCALKKRVSIIIMYSNKENERINYTFLFLLSKLYACFKVYFKCQILSAFSLRSADKINGPPSITPEYFAWFSHNYYNACVIFFCFLLICFHAFSFNELMPYMRQLQIQRWEM